MGIDTDGIKDLKNRYCTKAINNIETLILEAGKILNFNVYEVFTQLNDVSGIVLKNVENIIDGYLLLSKGNKLTEDVKSLINEESFIDQNPSVISHLSKIYFHADHIKLVDNNIVAQTEISLPKEEKNIPDIKAEKVIPQVLKKLKYNRFLPKDLESIQQIGKFSQYRDLYDLIIQAIDKQNLILKLSDDDLFMNFSQLKEYLDQ